MDFSPIIQRLNELTTFMNNVRTLSKKIFELPPSTAGNKLVAVYNETSLQTEKFNLTEALDGMYSLTNGITAIGNITRDGADFTFEVGFEWKINGIEYSNAEITRTINDAGTGNHRIDIAVCDTNNNIYIIEGFEVPLATAVVQPPTPPNTLFICYFLITESVIGDNSTPGITGQNNIPLYIEIASLTDANISTFVSYINTLSTPLVISEYNSLVEFKVVSLNTNFRLVGIGKGTYGLGQTQIAPENVMKITFSGGSEDLQQVLENGGTYTSGNKSITITESGITVFDTGTLSQMDFGLGDSPENDIYIVFTPNAGGQTELLFPKTESTENVAYQSYVDTGLSDKVDKIPGKGLSTEDYTTAEKSKLAGIASGATANDTDANLKNRENHTGTQAISTISGLQTYLNKINSGIVSSAEKTLTNTTSAQAIYDADLNAEANCTYEIFGSADFTGLAVVSSYLSFSLLGTATIDSFSVTVLANKATNNQAQNMSNVSSNATQITSNSAASYGRILFFGTVRVSGAGTVKPSVAFSSATGSMKVSANAKFSFNKIGSNTVTNY